MSGAAACIWFTRLQLGRSPLPGRPSGPPALGGWPHQGRGSPGRAESGDAWGGRDLALGSRLSLLPFPAECRGQPGFQEEKETPPPQRLSENLGPPLTCPTRDKRRGSSCLSSKCGDPGPSLSHSPVLLLMLRGGGAGKRAGLQARFVSEHTRVRPLIRSLSWTRLGPRCPRGVSVITWLPLLAVRVATAIVGAEGNQTRKELGSRPLAVVPVSGCGPFVGSGPLRS